MTLTIEQQLRIYKQKIKGQQRCQNGAAVCAQEALGCTQYIDLFSQLINIEAQPEDSRNELQALKEKIIKENRLNRTQFNKHAARVIKQKEKEFTEWKEEEYRWHLRLQVTAMEFEDWCEENPEAEPYYFDSVETKTLPNGKEYKPVVPGRITVYREDKQQ